MEIFYNNDYTATKHAFDTTRKSAQIAARLLAGEIPGVDIADPKPFYKQTEKLIKSVHSTDYVKAVQTGKPRHLAESQGFKWDQQTYTTALAHNSGIVAGVRHTMQNGGICGTLSSGLHHARKDYGSGFCTFNGLAVGIKAARQEGAKKPLIIDFDAHGGGGTYSLVKGNATQIDVVVSPFDTYLIDPYDYDSTLIVIDADDYLPAISEALESVADNEFDFILYNAGMDPFNGGVSASELEVREKMVAAWLQERNVPTVFTLAGGYSWGGVTRDEIADLHLLTIEILSRETSADANGDAVNFSRN